MINAARVKRYLYKKKCNIEGKLSKKMLESEDFTIISSNCLAGKIYNHFGIKYKTPTIGLFFYGEDFLNFIEDIDKYLISELDFIKTSKHDEINKMREEHNLRYPIGKIDDIEIQFLHYENQFEAKEKWTRRCKRINKHNIFIIDTDRDGFKTSYVERYDKINYPKIIFTSKQNDKQFMIQIKEYIEKDCVGDLYNDCYLFKYVNFVNWINKRKLKVENSNQ